MATLSCRFYSRYLAYQTQVCAALPEMNEDPLPELISIYIINTDISYL